MAGAAAFDPSQPFDVVAPQGQTQPAANAGSFDPTQPFDVLGNTKPPADKGGFWRNLGAGATEFGTSILGALGDARGAGPGIIAPEEAPRANEVTHQLNKAAGKVALNPEDVTANSFGEKFARNLGTTIPSLVIPGGEELTLGNALRTGATTLGTVGGQTVGQEIAPDSTTVQLATSLLGGGVGGAAASGKIAPALGKVASNYLGTTTGAGGRSLQEAFQAGKESNQPFVQNMRGNADPDKAVTMAKSALSQLRSDRQSAYLTGMGKISDQSVNDSAAYRAQMAARAEDTGVTAPKSNDPSVLSFDPVYKELSKTNKVKNFQGVDIDPETAAAREKVSGIISDWSNMDPETFHTPMGFDALKQRLGNLKNSLDYNSPERVVAGNAYNAVRKAIVDQAPDYAGVMKDYEHATDQIDSIEKTLSLGPKASKDTALRKLQSLMRNDVSANYGARAKLGDVLSQYEPDLPKVLAGQSLSSAAPRGVVRAAAALATLPTAPLYSPRLMGELSYGAGRMLKPIIGDQKPFPTRGLIPAANPIINQNQSPYRKGGFIQ